MSLCTTCEEAGFDLHALATVPAQSRETTSTESRPCAGAQFDDTRPRLHRYHDRLRTNQPLQSHKKNSHERGYARPRNRRFVFEDFLASARLYASYGTGRG